MKSSCILVALISFVSFCNSARGAILLDIPGIPGDETATGFEGWIDVTSFSLGETHSIPNGSGSGGVASLMDISLTKPVDSSSPKLASAISQGERFPTVDLDVVRPVNDLLKTDLEYRLEDVILTSFTETGAGTGTVTDVTDAISLNARRIDFTLFPSSGSPITGTFSGSTAVPEPSTLILAALGGLGLLACRRRFA